MRTVGIAAAILVLAAAPAFAKKGGHDKSGSALTPAGITLNESEPHFGDAVTFSTTHDPLRDGARIWVRCWQGETWVFQVASTEAAQFLLAGGSWTGGAAHCSAELFYYEYQGQTATNLVSLALTEFDVAA